MAIISKGALRSCREETFRLASNRRLHTLNNAANFVKDRGFVYLWPIKGIVLPNLWEAVAGDRRVANEHDDPGHVTWGWKDSALGKRIWYYGKILRKRATMIDLDIVPYFYALSENHGVPEEDILIQYHEGRLTLEAKAIFEALLENGPMDTLAIRQETRMTSKDSKARFQKALSLLQSDFKILPVGISESGGWRYAFIYDLTHRYYPELLDNARFIKEQEARQKLTELYFQSLGAAKIQDITKLFGWKKIEADQAIQSLVTRGILGKNIEIESETGEWFVLAELT